MKAEKINPKTAIKPQKELPFTLSRNALSLSAVPFFQRKPVTQAKSADVIQRHPADDGNKDIVKKPLAASVAAVKKYKKDSKKTKAVVWKRVLESVETNEAFWAKRRNHVMLGENETPPGGFHSKKSAADAFTRVVGPTNPPNAGKSVVYKQWHKNKTDNSAANLNRKISTFFPDNWEEEKIMAAVLLKNAGEEHQVEASFGLVANEGTAYPESDLADPA
ncbi:MAG TPA: EndoU domain-containing protein [Mucilaginibacter sp.]|jgi:hypothetical protein|nr:EndoU domain-containing protein [Mucilaginibacter sp.]